MSSQPTEAAAQTIFDVWSVYDQVLDRNYMFHEELYSDVRRVLQDHFDGRPISIIDLGCGSARHLAPVLEGRAIARYVGCDLSETALAHAAQNLAGIGGPVELRQGDLLKGLKADPERFDLIFSSFALHHLSASEKADFLRLAHERLESRGLVLLIDVMREENEALPLYLGRYCQWINTEWTALPQDALAAICEHVRHNDLPETASELAGMAREAGFDQGAEIGRYRWHRIWSFQNNR